jgi:cellulose synthase/poly-beta-1,6-N-acetylglucosamine synthase-like glycosyltransferase
MSAVDFLLAMDLNAAVTLFWFTVLFDIPRYLLGMIVIAVYPRVRHKPLPLTVTAIIAGYNEGRSLHRAVTSAFPQVNELIVVDDGSTDNMYAVALNLKQQGLIHHVIRNDRRESKIEAVNVGIGFATSELVLILDADTSLAPDAVQNLTGYFRDPKVAAVGSNLRVENEAATLTTRCQAIEYAIGLSMSRQVNDALGIVSNVSGACGLFRRQALLDVDKLDMEVAEDGNLAMKLRKHGYRLHFSPFAIASTNVPETLTTLTRQRLRWDSAIITLWWNKYAHNFNPFSCHFRPMNLLTSLDVIWFSMLMPLVMPVYIVWLWMNLGDFTLTLLAATWIGLTALDLVVFMLARVPLRLLPYLPFYSLMQIGPMRLIRLAAIICELIFIISHHDNYIPKHQRHRLS